MNSPFVALSHAVEFFGDHKTMARALGVTSKGLKSARLRGRVSGELAEKIQQLTGGAIKREELRPDLFPRQRHYNRVRLRRLGEQQQSDR
jgi:DNA-binding transcriptional regulator YdaS (Cro superfamily)